jgi:membrane protein
MTIAPAPPASRRSTLMAWADGQKSEPTTWHELLRQVIRLILITAVEFSGNALSLRSAALTYTVLLSLVPVLAMSTALVKGLGGDNQLRKAAYSYIDTLSERNGESARQSGIAATPGETSSQKNGEKLTDHLRSAVDQLFDYVDKTNFATLGSIGVVGILLSVILVLSYIEEAMNVIWKAASGRSLVRKIADYLTLLILLPISINVAFAASAMLQSPAMIAKIDILIPFAWLQTLLLKAMPVAIITLTFYVMYIFFPNTKVKTLPALFGAGLASLLWTLVQDIYISLQIGVANYNAIYGSFATLPLFLVWIYLGWLFILTGAQVAYACQNIRSYRLLPVAAAPSQKLAAAFDIMDCILSAFAGSKAVTSENLTGYLPRYQPAIIIEVVTQLCEAGVLHVSQTDNRLLPASSGKGGDYQEVVAVILGTNTTDTDGGARSRLVMEAAAKACNTPVQQTYSSEATV